MIRSATFCDDNASYHRYMNNSPQQLDDQPLDFSNKSRFTNNHRNVTTIVNETQHQIHSDQNQIHNQNQRQPPLLQAMLTMPLGLPISSEILDTQSILGEPSDHAYMQFREKMIKSRKNSNEVRRSSGSDYKPQSFNRNVSTNLIKIETQHQTDQNISHNQNQRQYQPQPSMLQAMHNMQLGLPITPEILATQSILGAASDHAYLQFREKMIQSRKNTNEVRRNSGSDHKQQSFSSNGSNGNNRESTPIYVDENSEFSNVNSSGNSSICGEDMGSLNVSNQSNAQSMRKRGQPLPEDAKDEAYWERRRKNNEAAKRSRDARRSKEEEIAIRAAFLERENNNLRNEVAQLKIEANLRSCEVAQLKAEANIRLKQQSIYYNN